MAVCSLLHRLLSPGTLGMVVPRRFLASGLSAADEVAPDPEAREALQGYNLLHTDRNVWIELSTDASYGHLLPELREYRIKVFVVVMGSEAAQYYNKIARFPGMLY